MPDVVSIPIDGELHARFKGTVAFRQHGSMKEIVERLIIKYIESLEAEQPPVDPNDRTQ